MKSGSTVPFLLEPTVYSLQTRTVTLTTTGNFAEIHYCITKKVIIATFGSTGHPSGIHNRASLGVSFLRDLRHGFHRDIFSGTYDIGFHRDIYLQGTYDKAYTWVFFTGTYDIGYCAMIEQRIMYQQLTQNRLYPACRRYPLPGGVPTTKASDRPTHKRLINNNLHQKSQEQSVVDPWKLLYILIASQGKSTKSAQDCCQ